MIKAAKIIFSKHPFISNSLIYGSLYVGAEYSQQLITKRVLASPKEEIDFSVIGRYAVMGTLCYSPTLYTWYKWLDGNFKGTSTKIIVKKLLLDQFVLTPVLLVMFYTGMAMMENAEDPFEELKHKFMPTFLRSCLFWLPAQSVNFLFVAPKYRIVYVGACAFAWVNILCWIKRQRIQMVTEEI